VNDRIRTRRIRGDGIELAVFEQGPEGAPTIVLVHGYPDTHAVWDGVAAALADRFHVVRYDVRGAGQSEIPRRRVDYRLDRLAGDLRAVITATSGGKPAHVVGHDWGSIQSWELVTDPRARALLAGYTSISGPCLDHVGYWLRDGRGRGRQAIKSWYIYAIHVPGLAERAWRGRLGRAWPRILERRERVRIDASPTQASDGAHGAELYRANMMRRWLRPRQRRAQTRVQLIVPTYDRYVGPDVARTATRWCQDIVVHELRAGHWVVRSDPETIGQMVREFVEAKS
jgi:pimeloyl-ACP methyl ester carboxylesterase